MRFDRIRPRAGFPGWGRLARRVAAQEYIPFAAWLIAWAAFTAAAGLTAVVLLMAANGLVQAIRSLFLTQSFDAMSARIHGPKTLKARARRAALRVDAVALAGCLALLVAVALGLRELGQVELAAMMMLMTFGLPARTPALLALDRSGIGTAWRMGSAAALVAGAGLVLLFDLHWTWCALVLGLKEWGGLAGAWLDRSHKQAQPASPPSQLAFTEIAARTSLAARRRLVYRIGKLALSVLGPIGTVIARTGRGGGLDARLASRLPANPAAIAILAFCCTVAATALVIAGGQPAHLLIASVAARIGAAATSALVWWPWNGAAADFPEWLNEDI